MFFELFDEDTAGVRPTGLVEPPGSQERVPRHTVEQMADRGTPLIRESKKILMALGLLLRTRRKV